MNLLTVEINGTSYEKIAEPVPIEVEILMTDVRLTPTPWPRWQET